LAAGTRVFLSDLASGKRGCEGCLTENARVVNIERSSGVQLHPTSLPAGRLGDDAYRFVDWLAAAGQSWWQMLPVGPPDKHGSPYKAKSAFAAWEGLLADPSAPVSDDELEAFRARNRYWVRSWEDVAGVEGVRHQVRFEREWSALRAYALEHGVRLIGDVPIYVAPGGADHRAWPELFRSAEQSGCPPDAFTEEGQLWGNPIYDWPAIQRRGYRWWIERFRRTFDLFDLVRVDHFRGFVAYWVVDARADTAKGGAWRRGPGAAVFRAVERELGALAVIAEDLGDITPAVTRVRRELGFPGMGVLQFGFGEGDEGGPHHPSNWGEDQVVYTGTHDNDTLGGWWASADTGTRDRALAAARAAGVEERDPVWAMIALAFSASSALAMIQAQDVLGLGSEARMNLPGTKGSSWKWRLQPGQLTGEHAERLREVTEAAGRVA
jgi:4-alpha-glucanotransferase